MQGLRVSRIDRLYKIHDLLRNARHPVPMKRFMEELEATRNTVTRDFEYLRDTLGAPLEYVREQNGHRYNPEAPVFEMPGFWMNPGELYALLACEQLLENVQPGLLASRLAPLKSRIRNLLGSTGHDAERVSERIHIQPLQSRTTPHPVFDPVAEATLDGRAMQLTYSNRSDARHAERSVHPQRLLHYRSNWYLLAWCEQAGALRLFSLDRIRLPRVTDQPARRVPEQTLDQHTGSGFGIFGGQHKAVAHLRFNEHAARWVAEELWHADQQGEWKEDGFHLQVPYSDSRELTMEILRYGPDVEVLGPEELREEVAGRVRAMVGIYW